VKEDLDFRARWREDAGKIYQEIFESLKPALDSEVTKWGNCPECNHKVPVIFADLHGRSKAVQLLIEQGFGKPPETIEVTAHFEADLQRWRGYLQRMTEEERAVMVGFLQREEGLQPALPVGEDADDGEAEPAGGLSANGVAHV